MGIGTDLADVSFVAQRRKIIVIVFLSIDPTMWINTGCGPRSEIRDPRAVVLRVTTMPSLIYRCHTTPCVLRVKELEYR